MKRLFFALWPDDITRQKCVKITVAINKSVVSPTNLHVTLLFLGNVTLDKETVLRQEAAIIPPPKLTLCFNRLSFWKKPGVLCLTSTDDNPELISLVNNLAVAAKKLEIPVDQRPYKPHVTLVKKAKASKTLGFEPVNWRSNSFCLVESCSQPNGVEYRIIEQWEAK
ncbi:MAG: RNA 2',3'-cyclic phosphodiesterase [Methyloglobulus sp.]